MIGLIRNNIKQERINVYFILLTVFAFPGVVIINYLFEIQNSSLSKILRFINVLFSLYLLINFFLGINYKKFQVIKSVSFFLKEKIKFILFFCFFIFYIIRVIIDLESNHLNEITIIPSEKTYYYYYLLGVTLLPLLAALTIKTIDFDFLKKILYRYLVVINISFLLIFIADKFFSDELVGRFVISRNGFDYYDSISIAIYSSLLILLSFIYVSKNYYNYAFLFLGCFILMSTASRGAILALLISILYLLFFKDKKFTIKYFYFLLLTGGSLLLSYFVSLFFKNNFQGDNVLIYRLNNVVNDGSTASRLKIIKDAFYQILEAPIFGSHFLVIESKMYAHNILLDILVSTGLLGLLLIIPIFLLFAKNIISKFPYTYITVIGFFYFLNTMTSGAVYNMYEFWIIFAVIVGYQPIYYKLKNNNEL